MGITNSVIILYRTSALIESEAFLESVNSDKLRQCSFLFKYLTNAEYMIYI